MSSDNVSDDEKKRIESYLLRAETGKFWIADYLNEYREDINKVLNNKHGIDIVRIARAERPHANMMIINHDVNKIFYFEPHVGNLYDDLFKPVMEAFKPIADKYKLETVDACPQGLQSVTGDSLCATWSIFGGLLFGLNPNKDVREMLNYLIGQGELVEYTLEKFCFYIYHKYADTINKINIKAEPDILLDTLGKMAHMQNNIIDLRDKSDDKNIRKFLSLARLVNSKVIDELLNIYKNIDDLPPMQVRIIDGSSNYLRDLNDIITNIDKFSSSEHMKYKLNSILQVNFDLEIYGEVLRKKAEKYNCILI